ncbi:MAG: ketoacyl-ACP synthase III [Proteobacteria bacterium]|nr:ketoacyl-ACP synthase III [Pseudomonadota bacterium]
MTSIRILGTGSYVPPRVLSNQDLEAMGLETSDEWIVKRTGIRERRIADPGMCSSDMGHLASKKALAAAGLSPDDLDLIVVATATPDTCCPAAANWLQAHLGASRAFSFDITAACSGFVFALDVASQYIKAGTCRTVLVVAAETMTRTLDWTERSSCILWGDGAGAAILSAGGSGPELLSTHIHTDGASGSDLLLPGGGSKTTPISHESVDRGLHFLRLINADQTFRVAVRRFLEAIREGTGANNVEPGDIDWFIPHQANLRMFVNMAKSLDVPMERFYVTIDRYGNMSSASCAVSLAEAVEDGSIRPGQLVCMPVFGGGLTWGCAMIRF